MPRVFGQPRKAERDSGAAVVVGPRQIVPGRRGSSACRRVAFVTPGYYLGGVETVNCALADGLPRDEFAADVVCYTSTEETVAADADHWDRIVTLGPVETYGRPCPDALSDLLEWVLRDYALVVAALCCEPLRAAHKLGLPAIEYWHGVCGWNSMDKPAARILAVSRDTLDATRARRMGLLPPCEVLYNGLDVQRFSSLRRDPGAAGFGLRGAEKVLLYCGRLSHEKRPEDAIAVAGLLHRRNPAWKLLLAGEVYSYNREHYLRLMQAAGLVPGRDVAWVSLARDQVARAYAAADCLLHPSLEEGFGMVLAEALAAGVPIVTTGVGGSGEVVGEAALRVPVCDTAAMAEAVASIFTDDATAGWLAQAGRERAKLFRIEAQQERFLQIVREMVA